MTDQLPADIVDAIEAFEKAVNSDAYCPGGSVDQTRAALEAVILKHVRATDQTNTGE